MGVIFPNRIDVLLPIIDGWTPIAAKDLNAYQAVITKIQEVLGYGKNWFTYSAVPIGYGPKGANADVRERLNKFLETDSAHIRDVAFVTGTRPLGDFHEDAANRNTEGAYIGFGKAMSRAGYGPDTYLVLFTALATGTEDISATAIGWDHNCPCLWWVGTRVQDGCRIVARKLDGSAIVQDDQTPVTYALLVFGHDAFLAHN